MDTPLHPQRPSQQFDDFALPVRHVDWQQPLVWLAAGWGDLMAAPRFSIGLGLIFSAIGLGIFAVAAERPQFLIAAVSGFLIVAPILGVAFYELARQREANGHFSVVAASRHLLQRWRPLAVFGLLLAAFFFAWNVLTTALVTHALGSGWAGGIDLLLREVMLSDRHPLLSMAWIASGGLLAALAFIVSAITAPALLDRDVSLACAVATSFSAVAENRAAMGLWAFSLATLTFAGMLPWMLGVAITMPWLAYASWHAYRDLAA
jgi:uncharacterized membrane protein